MIKLNNIKSIELGVDHLIGLGHKKIGIIMGPMKITTGIERLKGYKKALKKNNIELDGNMVKFAGSTIGMAKQKTKELLTGNNNIGITAIVATNTTTTTGILLALKEMKINIPEDISIVGFGNSTYYSLIEPPLTIIKQPLYRFGVLATETLLRLLKGNKIKHRTIELEPKILIRDSCKKIN